MSPRHPATTADAVRAPIRAVIPALAAAAVAVAVAVVGGFVGTMPAFAATPTVSIPAGPFLDGQSIAVSGSGFPTHAQDPAGLQIIECSDPQGSAAHLPTDPSLGCEGITVNAGQINPDSAGRFHASYPIAALSSSGAGTSSIDCDATHQCVLWVGTDYNNAFLTGPHAFTKPFTVTASAPTGTATTGTSVTPPPTAAGTAPAVTAASPGAATSAAAGGTLASTGLPGLVLWLFALGAALALLGLCGRRLTTIGRPGAGQ